MIELTAARVRELLHYDPETGVFQWRSGPRKRRSVIAGGLDSRGYVQIRIGNTQYMAHRLAWLYVHGEWPSDQVDHKDGDPVNNRLDNLRDVSNRVNRENLRGATSRSKSGKLGVWAPTRSTPFFVAAIMTNGKQVKLGKFATADAAHEAYLTAKRQLHQGCTL